MNNKPPRIIRLLTHLRPKSGVLWTLLAVLSLAPLFPLSNFVGHPRWDLIRWIPFQDFSFSLNTLKDIVGNILWFMLLGYLLHYQLNKGSFSQRTLATIVVIAGCISISVEFFQVFCLNRFPSMTDVTCNVLGAGLGGYLAQKQYTVTAAEPWPTTWLANLFVRKRFN